MKEPSNFEEITEYLLSLIPKEEIYKRKDVTREQIEKAAMEYAERIPQSDERREYSREDFIAGAQWRINSVWHEISECKDVKRKILVEYKNGHFDALPDIRDLKGVEDLVARVAYVDDLLPERKEETE